MDRETRRPIADARLVLREEFDDWAILFDPDSGNGYGLSPVGVFIWKLLDGTRDEDDLLTEIRRHFDDVPDNAGNDITELIDGLTERGLVGYEVTSE
jgi:SynChlorMet cassette protein ScmD